MHYHGIIGYGQSPSVGGKQAVVLSTDQPYFHLTFVAGTRATLASNAYGGTNNGMGSLKGLREDLVAGNAGDVGLVGETFCTTMATVASELYAIRLGKNPKSLDSADRCDFIVSTAGKGAQSIAQLSPSNPSQPTDWFENFKAHVRQAKRCAEDLSATYSVAAIVWLQGETDIVFSTGYAAYKAALKSLQQEAERWVRIYTGQAGNVPFLLIPTTYGATTWGDAIARAQYDLARECPSRFCFVTNPYMMPHCDENHRTAFGHCMEGAYLGRAVARLIEGPRPEYLQPISATVRGQRLELTFDVPKLPLRWETSLLPSLPQYGIFLIDETGNNALSSYAIDGPCVRANMVRPLHGDAVVSLALRAAVPGGPMDATGCNLRDSTSAVFTTQGGPVSAPHCAPACEIPVVVLADYAS